MLDLSIERVPIEMRARSAGLENAHSRNMVEVEVADRLQASLSCFADIRATFPLFQLVKPPGELVRP